MTETGIARACDASSTPATPDESSAVVYESLKKLEKWVEDHDYEAYEPFDGLSSPLARFTFGTRSWPIAF